MLWRKSPGTVTATTVQYAEAIVENGVPTFRPCGDEVIPGEITDQVNALQYLRKKYGVDRSFVVTGMTTDTKKYVMDLATFIATATPVAVVAKQDAPTDSEADAEPADETGANADTVNPATPAAPVINAPTNNPLPGSQAGVYPGSPVTPPAGTAPFGAPPTAEAPIRHLTTAPILASRLHSEHSSAGWGYTHLADHTLV